VDQAARLVRANAKAESQVRIGPDAGSTEDAMLIQIIDDALAGRADELMRAAGVLADHLRAGGSAPAESVTEYYRDLHLIEQPEGERHSE
jgi:hypothetical protein